jgi:hypothetical protein
MPTIVQLTSSSDTMTFHATPDVNGWVYDNVTLDKWYAQAKVSVDVRKRPNAHGAYDLGTTDLEAHEPVITGQYYGASPLLALQARDRLARMYNDGDSVIMSVTDELGTTSREVWLIDRFAPFRADFSHFPFDLAFVAPDPRRYGAVTGASEGMPTPGSGLVWNLGTAGSGLYFDWGTAGVDGIVSVENTGSAASPPIIHVGGAGGFESGFRVTEIETGRELTLALTTVAGDIVSLDSRTQSATLLGGGDVSRFLTSRKWFEIPAGATYRYYIAPLAGVTGAPTMTVYIAPATL